METELIVIEKVSAVEVFSDRRNLEPFLADVERIVMAHVPDLTTAKGRADIASLAHKVAKTKVRLDDLGKNLVTDWKQKASAVDASRKFARDFLDDLKTKARKPLTEWEEAEIARLEAEKLQVEIENAHDIALVENDLFTRQKDIERKEAEYARIEAEKQAKEHAERIAKEQADRDERIRREAAEKAEKAASEAISKAERERVAAEERAKLEAAQAEMNRVAAEQKAKEDQEAAVKAAEERIRLEAERNDRERLAAEEKARLEAERKAANAKHRAKINREAAAGLVSAGCNAALANDLIEAVAGGKVPHIKIEY